MSKGILIYLMLCYVGPETGMYGLSENLGLAVRLWIVRRGCYVLYFK